MPLTPQDKERILRENGFDPAKWDIDDSAPTHETTAPLTTSTSSPSVDVATKNIPDSPTRKISPIETVGAEAVKTGIEAIPALYAGGRVSTFLASKGVPAYYSIPAGIVTSAVVGLAESPVLDFINDKITPPPIREYYREAEQQNPNAAKVGSIAGNLAFFNAAGGARNLLNIGKLTPEARIAAAKAMGIGAGSMYGTDIGMQALTNPEGQDIDYLTPALSALGYSTLMTSPTRLGARVMGLPTVKEPTTPTQQPQQPKVTPEQLSPIVDILTANQYPRPAITTRTPITIDNNPGVKITPYTPLEQTTTKATTPIEKGLEQEKGKYELKEDAKGKKKEVFVEGEVSLDDVIRLAQEARDEGRPIANRAALLKAAEEIGVWDATENTPPNELLNKIIARREELKANGPSAFKGLPISAEEANLQSYPLQRTSTRGYRPTIATSESETLPLGRKPEPPPNTVGESKSTVVPSALEVATTEHEASVRANLEAQTKLNRERESSALMEAERLKAEREAKQSNLNEYKPTEVKESFSDEPVGNKEVYSEEQLKKQQEYWKEKLGGNKPVEETTKPKSPSDNTVTLPEELRQPLKLGSGIPFPEEFFKWFGESKVVDNEGRPLVVYHGTAAKENFEAFRKQPKRGLFFTSDPKVAGAYAGTKESYGDDKTGGRLIPVYLSLKNPARYENLPEWMQKELKNSSNYAQAQRKIFENLRGLGYDGFIWDKQYVAFEPTQVKSAIANRGTYDPDNPNIMYSGLPIPEVPEHIKTNAKKGIAPKWTASRSMTDDIRSIDHPLASKAADSADNYWRDITRFYGKYTNKTLNNLRDMFGIRLTKGAKLEDAFKDSSDESKRIMSYMDDIADYGKSDITLTPEEQATMGKFKSWLEQHNIKTGEEIRSRPGLRNAELGADMKGVANDPKNYIMRAEVGLKQLNTLLNHPESPEAVALKKDFIKHQEENGSSHKEALDLLKTKLDAYSYKATTDEASSASTFYGPAEKASGINVPKSWRPESPIERVSRYDNSLGKRLSFYDSGLDPKNPLHKEFTDKFYDPIEGIYTKREVQDNLRYIFGNRQHGSAIADAAAGVVKSVMFSGPGTGVKDVITSVLGNASEYETPMQSVKSVVPAIENFVENRLTAIDKGLIKEFGAIEFADQTSDPTYWLQFIRKARDWTTKLTGRDIAEQIARTLSLGKGKWITDDFYTSGLKEGKLSTMGERYFEKFGKDTGWKEYFDKGEALPEEIKNEIAARYAENAQSTYDPRDTQKYVMEGQFAPYLSILRWNFNRYNRFYKGAIIPLINGNPIPIISATLGMVASGMAVKAYIRHVISGGRKEHEAEPDELYQAYKEDKNVTDDVIYKAVALMDAAGYAGMLAVLAKGALDRMHHNNVMTVDSPLVSALGNIKDTLLDMGEAIKEGNSSTDVVLEGISKALENNIQVYRIILNNFSEEKQKQIERSNKFRDLKTFKDLYGYDTTDTSKYKINPFLKQDERKFKQTGDLEEAKGLRKSIIEEARKKYVGRPTELRRYLDSLKGNSYQTMPSPESDLKQFREYKKYLTETQGADEAEERQKDYLRQSKFNRSKSASIP